VSRAAGRAPGRRRQRARLVLALAVLGVLTSPPRAIAADGPVEALKRGLASPEADQRIAALRHVARAARDLTPEQRRQEVLLLRRAFAAEPSSLVRVETVGAFAALADDAAWVPVVQASLADRDDAVRSAATTALLVCGADGVDALGRLLREDDDPTFRAEVALLLGRRRRGDALPVLLAALRDPHPRVATAAAEALEAVTGEALGPDPAAWDAWRASRGRPSAVPPRGETVTGERAPPAPPPPPPPVRGLAPSLYGLPIRAKDVVFVVDVSGSIGDEGVRSAKAEVLAVVERLASDVRFSALFFDADVKAWHPEMVRATPTAKGELARWVKSFGRGKRTDVLTAVHTGLSIVTRRAAEKKAAGAPSDEPATLVVVSDGRENLRATPTEALDARLDRLDLARVVIHAIVVGGKDSALLAALARRGAGTYRVVP
jgi:HEAT repeat protein